MKYLLILAFCLSASVATARSCQGKDVAVIPEMEAAKDAFYRGNYQEFAKILGAKFPVLSDGGRGLFAPLENQMDGSYSSCHTIIQRHETPGFYQDVVLYYSDQVSGPITLLLVGSDIGGEFRFLEFTFDFAMLEVLNRLR